MPTPSLARLCAAVVLLAVPATARAQFVVYIDRASFLAATSNAGTDTFDDLPAGSAASPLARSAGSFGYVGSVNTTEFFAVGSDADRWLSTNTSTDVITFSGFGSTVRGIGGFFFGTDDAGVVRPATSLTLRATNAGGTTTRTLANTVAATFLGFVSTSDIVSLTVETVLPEADLAWPTVDDLVLAEGAAVNVVPEPSAVVLFGTGAVGIALLARRRRTA